MSKHLQISSSQIFERLKISCQLAPAVKETAYRQIITDAVRAENITVSDLELQQAADSFRVRYNLYNPAVTWDWMKKNYLTGDELEQIILESIITSKLTNYLFSDRVEPYFYEHKLDYTKAVLYEVVFDDFDTAIEQFYALQEREITFIEVARRYILEPNSRRQHGYRGVLPRTALNSAISAAVFASNPPQVLKPIIVGKNTHLILVEEIIEPQLNKSLRAQILNSLFSSWLEQQLQQYSIEVETLQPLPQYQQQST